MWVWARAPLFNKIKYIICFASLTISWKSHEALSKGKASIETGDKHIALAILRHYAHRPFSHLFSLISSFHLLTLSPPKLSIHQDRIPIASANQHRMSTLSFTTFMRNAHVPLTQLAPTLRVRKLDAMQHNADRFACTPYNARAFGGSTTHPWTAATTRSSMWWKNGRKPAAIYIISKPNISIREHLDNPCHPSKHGINDITPQMMHQSLKKHHVNICQKHAKNLWACVVDMPSSILRSLALSNCIRYTQEKPSYDHTRVPSIAQWY